MSLLYGAPIDRFDGTEFDFLSNFYVQDVMILYSVLQSTGHYKYYFVPTVEHAYQADKCLKPSNCHNILMASSPAKAKKYGQLIEYRSDWETIKVSRMKHWLKIKFADAYLADKLIEMTGDRELIEGNNWGDRFWGRVDGVGQNWLGRLLMEVREELKRND